GDRRGVARVLLVAERKHAQTRGLRAAGEVGDRNARQAVDRVEAVQLERVDDELKTIDSLRLCVSGDLGFEGAHRVTSLRDRYGKKPACGAALTEVKGLKSKAFFMTSLAAHPQRNSLRLQL